MYYRVTFYVQYIYPLQVTNTPSIMLVLIIMFLGRTFHDFSNDDIFLITIHLKARRLFQL